MIKSFIFVLFACFSFSAYGHEVLQQYPVHFYQQYPVVTPPIVNPNYIPPTYINPYPYVPYPYVPYPYVPYYQNPSYLDVPVIVERGFLCKRYYLTYKRYYYY